MKQTNQKYRNDFSRCDSDKCRVKDKCTRHMAHLEAVDLKLERVVYLDANNCQDNYYYNLALEEKR